MIGIRLIRLALGTNRIVARHSISMLARRPDSESSDAKQMRAQSARKNLEVHGNFASILEGVDDFPAITRAVFGAHSMIFLVFIEVSSGMKLIARANK